MDIKQREKLSQAKRKHGQANNRVKGTYATPTYRAWTAMIARCEDPKHEFYPRYGGRGIKVCERWRGSFEAFFDDMGTKPPRHSLDRVNNDGPYEPGNCRWAGQTAQATNRSSTRKLTLNGETLSLKEWAARLGVDKSTIQGRLKRGWSLHAALTRPAGQPEELKCYACDAPAGGIAWQENEARPACAERHAWDPRFYPEGAQVPAELAHLAPKVEKAERFCACGRIESQCDGSRKGCRAKVAK